MPLIGVRRALIKPKPVASGVAFSINYEAFASESSGTNTGTFNGVAVGPANINRVLSVLTGCRVNSATGVLSMMIGGVVATRVTGAASPTGPTVASDIWYASVPSGTTADIVVTWNGTTVTSGIQVYSIITSTPTPAAGNSSSTVSNTALSVNINVASGQEAIAGVMFNGTTSTLSNVTTDNSGVLAGPRSLNVGHTTTVGLQMVTASNGINAATAMSAAAWGP